MRVRSALATGLTDGTTFPGQQCAFAGMTRWRARRPASRDTAHAWLPLRAGSRALDGPTPCTPTPPPVGACISGGGTGGVLDGLTPRVYPNDALMADASQRPLSTAPQPVISAQAGMAMWRAKRPGFPDAAHTWLSLRTGSRALDGRTPCTPTPPPVGICISSSGTGGVLDGLTPRVYPNSTSPTDTSRGPIRTALRSVIPAQAHCCPDKTKQAPRGEAGRRRNAVIPAQAHCCPGKT